MRHLRVDDTVRLTQDVPELELKRGMVGVVRSKWFNDDENEFGAAVEVEFTSVGLHHRTRALLLLENLELEEAVSAA